MAAMAAWLPDVQHGRAESCKLLKYKLEEPHYSTNTWYFSRKEIEERSPSRKDGICLRKETYLRTLYCGFLQDLGKALKVPQVTIATSIMFCHRFYLGQSHAKNDWQTIATACIFLAGKAEDTPVWLKDLSVVSHGIIHKTDTGAAERIKQWEYYMKQKELILLGERILLSTIGFDFNIMHPYKPLVAALKRLKLEQSELTKVAWNIVNDCLQTTLCLQFKPHYIAACAMYLAAKLLNVKLPSGGGKVWWQEFDVAPFQLDEIIKQMFELLVPKRREPLPHTKTSSRLVPKINKQGGREDFSKSSEGTLQQLQNPVHVKVSSERMESEIRPCKGVQKRRASPIPHTVASPRRVSDFTTQDGREGFSSSSDESLDNLQHPVCVEVNDESMHSEIIPCNGRLSELQPYESMLLETGTGCAKFYEYNSRERQDVNECKFTEDGQMWTRVEISGVEEGNSTEENVNQSQHPFCVEINAGSLQSEIRHCQGKLSEALATSSSTMKTSVDVSLQNQDVNQYKVIEGNQMWVAVEISGVTTNSSSEASLNQVQLPVCIEVNAETMQSEIRISTGMQSGVGHRESVLLENSSGYMKSSENGSQQKQDVDKYRFTEGEMRIAVEISGVKKGIMRSSLNVISDVDKERIRESLKRRRKERATKQITAVASVEDSYDSWIEKELEDGIELTVQPPKWKARHDDEEDSYDSWIEKELEDGIELNSSSTKLENRDMMTKKTLMTPGLRKSWKMVVS